MRKQLKQYESEISDLFEILYMFEAEFKKMEQTQTVKDLIALNKLAAMKISNSTKIILDIV